MMKKLLVLLLTAALILTAFTGCSKSEVLDKSKRPASGEDETEETVSLWELLGLDKEDEDEPEEETEAEEPLPEETEAAAQPSEEPEETEAPEQTEESKPEPTEEAPAAHKHSYTEKVTKPTCTAGGYTTFSCTCGHSYKGANTAALGHDYTSRRVPATTASQGYTQHTCKRCGDSYKDNYTAKLPADEHSHSYTAKVTKPTCTAKGYTTHTCTCGASYQDAFVAALGHDYDTTLVPATTSAGGFLLHTCKRCDDSYKDNYTSKLPAPTEPEETKPQHTHDYTAKVTAPTCTAGGYTVHSCECGESYRDSETGALGHDYEIRVVEPTYDAGGYTEHTCKRCGESYKDNNTDKLTQPEETQPEETQPAHTHDYTEQVTAPTCTAGGYTTHSCGCGKSYRDSETGALGHDYEIRVVEPTCDAGGYTEHTCKRCGESYRDNNTDKLEPAHVHNYIDRVEQTLPTCMEKGSIRYLCACGDYTESVLPVDPNGHRNECTGEDTGYTYYRCNLCGKETKEAKSQDVYTLINAERQANGLPPIAVYYEAEEAAQVRAEEVAGYFSHTRPDGRSCFSIAQDYGLAFMANENIARGYYNAAAVVDGWMHSDGHRANLLADNITAMIVGRSGNSWVFMGFMA